MRGVRVAFRRVARVLVALAVGGCSLAHGELVWPEGTNLLVQVWGPGQSTGSFCCSNSGTAPVRIVNLDTSCGCFTARVDSAVIAPGAGARVETTWQIASAPEEQRQEILLTTDETLRDRPFDYDSRG